MKHTFGMIVPAANVAAEVEFNRWLPKNYQLHVARVRADTVGELGWRQQDAEVDYQAQLLGTLKPKAVALLASSHSFFGGDDYDSRIARRIAEASGSKAITSASAVGRALNALGARRVAMVSPYEDHLVALGKRYFELHHGIHFVSIETFNLSDPNQVTALGPEPVTAAFARACAQEPDALLMVGGAFLALDYVQAWEEKFQLPVVSTNQALLRALVLAAEGPEKIEGLGRLLREMPADRAA